MSMNIKSQEAHDLARELAALTGETVTQAVTTALRDRLTRVRREQDKEERRQRILELSRDIAARMPREVLEMDIDELLYDEQGMPRSDR